MKHQHSSDASKAPVRSAPKARARPARASKVNTPRPDESTDSRESAIRATAYAFYEARGRADGHDLDDWIQAEAEIDRAALVDTVESVDDRRSEP